LNLGSNLKMNPSHMRNDTLEEQTQHHTEVHEIVDVGMYEKGMKGLKGILSLKDVMVL